MSAPVVRNSTERLVVAGTIAPTIHDVHAWRLAVAGGRIEVHADPTRFRPMDDPSGRSLHLSCGAVLVNLRLAAAQLGREAVIRLLPDAGDPRILASVRLTRRRRVTREERLLYAATLRATPPRAVAGGRSAPDVRAVQELADTARLEGATMHVLPGAGTCRAVLTTGGDTPQAWMRAGRALQAVLLAATIRSVAVSFLYEIVDVPALGVPGDVPQVVLELSRAALPVDGQDERQRHRERVG
ncbi:putative NAD(P)H nitroreductase acg [Actinomadura rubteroloni]|uniref:Putative NAD(P)H nitroreductase acg n=1 Tax=Actinomadura rubteroloni TaxID=1926885 RepID=A0A2P4UF67_9ACTN|nr:hypothetical protein [Actinomadura rubteroloni]POM23685.1 putative NAD(P)H nitroreductase acg [Actinomadura rubteroloni]